MAVSLRSARVTLHWESLGVGLAAPLPMCAEREAEDALACRKETTEIRFKESWEKTRAKREKNQTEGHRAKYAGGKKPMSRATNC